ncbi:signal peptidase I [Streptomyces sp. NPDC006459]|uniref:signal peptidase I n=1 Tax=Streptomyces sp. NPDC006459 TaxID=3154303 RepID=UPI0033B40D0A
MPVTPLSACAAVVPPSTRLPVTSAAAQASRARRVAIVSPLVNRWVADWRSADGRYQQPHPVLQGDMRDVAGPRAADSVVRPRARGGRQLSVERVIAVGGDRIAYIPGDRKPTLNGKPLDEPYVLNGDPVAWTPGAFDVKVPEGRLFLLGDARGNSADPRYRFEVSEGGTAPLSAVKGKLIGEDDPLVVGLRSALPAGGGAVLAGVVAGDAALRLRRRTMTAGAPTADTVRVSGDRVPAELPTRTTDRIPPVLK